MPGLSLNLEIEKSAPKVSLCIEPKNLVLSKSGVGPPYKNVIAWQSMARAVGFGDALRNSGEDSSRNYYYYNLMRGC